MGKRAARGRVREAGDRDRGTKKIKGDSSTLLLGMKLIAPAGGSTRSPYQ